MAKIERHIVVVPFTSREVIERVRQAIDHGSRIVELTLEGEQSPIRCRVSQTRYRKMSTEYIGVLDNDEGAVAIRVINHPDMSDIPARVTITRRTQP